jgi:hypothetical protein
MTTQYDPTIIQQFADKLYEEAAALVYLYALFGLAIGALPSAAFALYWATTTRATDPSTSFFLIFASAALAAAIGAVIGRERGVALRLQAQTALCQARIEWNTRRV